MVNLNLNVSFIAILVIFLNLNLKAQIPEWAWAKSTEGVGEESFSNSCTDVNGNVYIAGFHAYGNITIGSTPIMISTGPFIAKYDPNGNVLWAKGYAGTALIHAVCTDPSGNLLITGSIFTDVTFGNYHLYQGSMSNIFLVKIDPNGTVLWAFSFGSAQQDDGGNAIKTDIYGNILLAGYFYNGIPGLGSSSLHGNGFLIKYDPYGQVIWQKVIGDSGNRTTDVEVDINGNVYLSGYMIDPVFNVGNDQFTNTGLTDFFLIKYDSNGNQLWAKSADDNVSDSYGRSIVTDNNGNCYLTGTFSGPNITLGTTTLMNNGTNAIYTAKYDPIGNVIWAKSAGGDSLHTSEDIDIDMNNNLLIAGSYNSTIINFASYTLNHLDTIIGSYDIFILKYDNLGNEIWAKDIQTNFLDNSRTLQPTISLDLNSNIFLTASFKVPTLTLGSNSLTNSGYMDLFIAKHDAVLGKQEQSNIFNIKLAPNPFNDKTILAFPNEQENTIVNIFDMLGNKLRAFSFTGKQLSIEKENLSPGVYFMQVRDKYKNENTVKIMVQ